MNFKKLVTILKIPCETCITKVICRYKKEINCSLLVRPYNTIVQNRYYLCDYPEKPERVLEKVLCCIFNWDYGLTFVAQVPKSIYISDIGKGSRVIENKKDLEIKNDDNNTM